MWVFLPAVLDWDIGGKKRWSEWAKSNQSYITIMSMDGGSKYITYSVKQGEGDGSVQPLVNYMLGNLKQR